MAKRRRPGKAWLSQGADEGGGASARQLRVGELVRQALADVFSREAIRDPVVDRATITVTEVRATADLRLATCYVMPLGGAEAHDVVAGLERLAPWLTGQVARRVRLKYAPSLRFRLDPSFDEADRIAALLRRPEVARDLGHDPGRDDGC